MGLLIALAALAVADLVIASLALFLVFRVARNAEAACNDLERRVSGGGL